MPLLLCFSLDNYAHAQTVDTRPFFLGRVGPGNEAREYHFENGISGFVSALTPTATISLIGLVGNKLIGTLNSITRKSDDNLGTSTGHESNNNSEMFVDTATNSQGGGSGLLTPVSDTRSEEGSDQFSTTADISTRQSEE